MRPRTRTDASFHRRQFRVRQSASTRNIGQTSPKRSLRMITPMRAPDIPSAKRAGLPVDLERLAAEGDRWLTPEDRYALKTHGVCSQAQDHVFMVRVRV